MKQLIVAVVLAGAVVGFAPAANAVEGQKGGLGPCLASYYVGPRAGYQMNDGGKIRTLELIEIFIFPVRIYDAYLAWNGEGWGKIVKEENLVK